MPRGSVTASFLLAWLDCGGKKHSGSTGFGKEGGGEWEERGGQDQDDSKIYPHDLWRMVCGKREAHPWVRVTSLQTAEPSALGPPAESKCQRSHGGGGRRGPTSMASYATTHSSDPPPQSTPSLNLRIFTVPWGGAAPRSDRNRSGPCFHQRDV